jgi:hypothetical protein
VKISLGAILSIAQVVPAIVSNIQRAFGKEPGSQKKAAAKKAANDIIIAVEGATGKDLVDNERVQTLLDEAIELGVTQMKIVRRLQEIDDEIRALRPVDDQQ